MKKEKIKHNRLINEKSPYLLQHADNPVNWYPWGEEAFKKAKKEDKPIFLSIGYSTCHWCHVMEHESFENKSIADILNKHFISIKVDREERPDVDNIYMTAVTSMTGQGGWPLSVFLTPDQKPFFGGTYFPPESRWGTPGFSEILLSISSSWENQRDKVLSSSEQITQFFIKRMPQGDGTKTLNEDTLKDGYAQFSMQFDSVHGGFGSAPKFPMGHSLSYLIRYWKRSGESKALEIVEKTVQEMVKGGVYDHLGGGFHRYSTDREWQVPHFEKMLYDQALLSKAYLDAYQATGKNEYAETVRDIFKYVLRDMQGDKGGFYSAEDADSLPPPEHLEMSENPDNPPKKSEGAFYLWTDGELNDILGKNAGIVKFYFGIKKDGNAKQDPHQEFTGKNILFIEKTAEETAEKFKKPSDEIKKILSEAKSKLFQARKKRPKPGLDDKVMVDWNGLMISSLAQGAKILNEPKYQEAAERAVHFILKNLVNPDGRLLHRYRDGEAGIMGTVEDYSFFINALLDLYETTYNAEYLKEAVRLTNVMMDKFWDDKRGGFYFTADDGEKLIYRQKEIYDGAIPSGNSFAALAMIRLSRMTVNADLESKLDKLFMSFSSEIEPRPSAYSQLLAALDFAIGPSKEIVIVGKNGDLIVNDMFNRINRRYIPNKVVVHRPVDEKDLEDILPLIPFIKAQVPIEGQPTAYICENHICKRPVTDPEELEKLLNGL